MKLLLNLIAHSIKSSRRVIKVNMRGHQVDYADWDSRFEKIFPFLLSSLSLTVDKSESGNWNGKLCNNLNVSYVQLSILNVDLPNDMSYTEK